MEKRFNHADMQNIKNYSGQNENYPNNIPNILQDLNMQDELVKFNDYKEFGAYTIVDEIMRLVTEYPAVREEFGKNSLNIIAALYFKGNIGSLNIEIGDSKDVLQDLIENETAPNPEEELINKEEIAKLQELSEQLREPCITLFELEFQGEPEYINYIKNDDFTALCEELAVYNIKGAHNTDSALFAKYRNIYGLQDDRIIGQIHTRFAIKIRHIFKNMKKDPKIRRIYNESQL